MTSTQTGPADLAGTDGVADEPVRDVVDDLAGIRPGSHLDTLRRHRAVARDQTQRAHDLLFGPAAGGRISRADRLSVAVFVAALHGADTVTLHYARLLDHVAPDRIEPLLAEARRAAGRGPWGHYREPDLAGESTGGTSYRPGPAARERLGDRLAAALAHAHLLVLHPRDARPGALAALVEAGWSRAGIVTLSQAVGFLCYQIRLVHGLQRLAAEGAA